MFTGKAKEKFEEWLQLKLVYSDLPSLLYDFNYHKEVPASLIWGVVQEFADSLGIDISIEVWSEDISISEEFSYNIWRHRERDQNKDDVHIFGEGVWTREESREGAIKKLNEIINKYYGERR